MVLLILLLLVMLVELVERMVEDWRSVEMSEELKNEVALLPSCWNCLHGCQLDCWSVPVLLSSVGAGLHRGR